LGRGIEVNVSIVGCGPIGAGWAALFATLGRHQARAWDPSAAARSTFAEKVARAEQQLIELGAPAGEPVTVFEHAEEALWGAQWVQENAPERTELKAQLLAHIETVVSSDGIIASSTSSFTWSQLASGLKHPDRFVIAHPFNPPHLVPLVELYSPDAATLDAAVKFYTDVDRVPVCMKKEAVGHIGNRLASALWREAVHLVAEGVASAEDIDRVLIHGPGLRWSVLGANLGYHLAGGEGGIEHYLHQQGPRQERRWSTLGNPRLTEEVCAKIASSVHAETRGRDIAELEAQRDRLLMELLRLRQEYPP
jgi:3-hydroxyacyl-CoA dehydrogenase